MAIEIKAPRHEGTKAQSEEKKGPPTALQREVRRVEKSIEKLDREIEQLDRSHEREVDRLIERRDAKEQVLRKLQA